MTDTLDDRERRGRERARRRELRQAASATPRPVRVKAARRGATARRIEIDETGPMAAILAEPVEQHEGLISWLVRMIMRIPNAIVAIVSGFLREVVDVLASMVRPLQRLVPTRRRVVQARSTIVDIEQDAPGGAFDDAVAGLRRRRDAAPPVLTPAQQRAADRKRTLLRRRIRGGAAICLVVLVVVGWRIVPSSDAFSIRHVEILGASSVGDLEVRTRVDDLLRGQTIYTIDSDAMRRKVGALPFVRSVEVDRHFPGGVTIRVEEHRPLALGYDTAKNTWWLIAPDGRVLAQGREEEWRDRIPLVRLDAKRVKPGMRLAQEPAVELLQSRAADSTLAFQSVEVKPYSVTATIQDGIEVRFGRPRQLRTKVAAAERMLQVARMKKWDLAYIDVSVPANPVPCRAERQCAAMPAPDEFVAADAAGSTSADMGAEGANTAVAGATATDADDAAAADDGAVTSTAAAQEQGPSRTTAATVLAAAEARSTDEDAPRDGFEAATRPDDVEAAAIP